MKPSKLITAIVVCLLLINSLQAQEEIKLENSVLWKIEHADLNEPSYILGTLHLMCEKDFEIPKKVTQAFQIVDALVLEVNLSNPEEVKIMQESMNNTRKISEELSKEQFDELDTLVTKIMGVSLINFDTYGLSILNVLMLKKMLPCSQIKSVDNEMMSLAIKNNKPIYSLEKVKEQMQIIDNAYPTEFALKQIWLYESYKKDFSKAIVAYKNEDITKAVALISKKEYMDKKATHIMQITRNKDWVSKMPQMMKERSNLFAVGAAHLTKDYGVIHLLRKKGYKVTPIFN